MTVRVAVAGLGTMGRQHARVLSDLPGVELVALCDESEDARDWARTAFPLQPTSDWRDLKAESIDAVINALPTPEHHETTVELLEAGKHVLVEKPIATTAQEADAMLATAERNNRVLMVGHVERFNPAVRQLQQVIESGELGDIISLASRRVGVARPVAPRTNVVIDLAIHDIDVAAFLLGRQGRLIFASGTTLGSNLLEDHADLVLRFGDAVASVQANWITPVKIRRIDITGTAGIAEVDYLTQSLRIYKGVSEVITGGAWNFFAVAQESEPVDVPITRQEPLRAELAQFVECIESGASPIGDPRAATQALALAIAATELIRGRSPA